MIRNHQPSPFNPGYGRKPAVFGGHRQAISELSAVFETLDFGENQSVLVSGLRGAGKTAMLSLLQDHAMGHGWLVISDDASRGLMDRVMKSTIPRIRNALSEPAHNRLSSFSIGQFGVSWEQAGAAREAAPLLRHDLKALSDALEGRGGLLITIDEVSSGRTRLRELSRFALEIQHALTSGANIMVVFAGIQVDLNELLKHEHNTFLRRSRRLDFRRLTPDETRYVIAETTSLGGRSVAPAALDHLTSISQGYPYLIQLVGDYAWRRTPDAPVISIEDADYALERGIKAVQDRVISRVYDDLSERDKDFLRAMAQDEGRTRIADLKARMDAYDQYVQVYKRRLIDTGYVQSAGHGYVEFSLPYLDQYIKSLIDEEARGSRPPADPWGDFPPPRI
ncbi:ATP-binding protein [Gulosibacter sp. 10]|uniref:ATP-binding protein n=1 Tax=Gulosibacter sp. 10 TaxID=1255570 RepID=UPI000B359871|nr:ATP-binding protein [Gulosibacter sp. 10]